MILGILADLVVLLHLAFVLFVIFGGLLALKWPGVVWLHLPALIWGVLVELLHIYCPLTTLEIWLREQGQMGGYQGDFIDHYVAVILYPGVTPRIQVVLGALLVLINASVYGVLVRRWRVRRRDTVV
jgi:hypothetical protein